MTTETQATIIQFDDIRKGDLIKVTYPYPNTKTLETIQGVAHKRDDMGRGYVSWKTESPEDRILISAFSSADSIIELLNRPDRKLPQVIGTVIKAKKVRGVAGDYILLRATPADEWDIRPWIVAEGPDSDYSWIAADEIEDWTEMVLTEKEDN